MVSNTTNNTFLDESRLISGLKKGDEEAFRILMERYQEKLFKVAYAITLDRGESYDIVQEVFIKVFQHIGSFKATSKLSTWLHRVTVNQSLNWKRRWKRRFRWHHRSIDENQEKGRPELGTDEQSPGNLYQEKELENLFWKKVKALPEEARTVLVLKEVEGLTYDEIASILKIKKGTVSSRIYYARQRLQGELKPYLSQNGET